MTQLFSRFFRQIIAIKRSEQGLAIIELALCLPFLLVVFFGTVEVTRYFLAIQKVEKTVDMITDVVAQTDPNSTTSDMFLPGMLSLFNIAPTMMDPYPMGANGIVIVTDVTQPLDLSQPPVINWQYCGGGTLAHSSALGNSGAAHLPLPNGFVMQPGEEVVIGEIYYDFSPLTLQDMIGKQGMSRAVFFVPRLGTLSSYTSKCM